MASGDKHRFHRSNPVYESTTDIREEQAKMQPLDHGIWTNESKETPWILSPRRMAVIALAVLVVAGAATFLQWRPARSANTDATGGKVTPAHSAVVMSELADHSALLTQHDDAIAKIQGTVRGFLGAGSIPERLRFVRHPEQTLRRMEEHYDQGRAVTPREVVDFPFITLTDLPPDYVFYAAMVLCDDGTQHTFSVMPEGDQFLIDWESSVGYNPMEWDTYLHLRPEAPLDWRLRVNPEDLYVGAFSDRDKWQSVRVSCAGSDRVSFAWISREHEDIDRINRLMQAGPDQSMILKLRFAAADGYESEAKAVPPLQVIDLVRETWIEP